MWEEILALWFEKISPAQWWKKDEAFDQMLRERFSETHRAAARCELYEWRKSARGRLAEIIVLDQFSRNMYRGTPASFAFDPLALALAQEAVALGEDRKLGQPARTFLYMPYMHSESPNIHEIAVELFRENGSMNLNAELQHKAIIDRFGRYPHRNAILGRESTPAEIEFLREPGSSF